VIEAILGAVRSAQHLLVTGHRSPDGDSIGSLLAVGLLLADLGKTAVLYGPEPVPSTLRFLPLAEAVTASVDLDARFDATIVVDAGDAALLGPDFPPRERSGPVIVLDHHAVNRPFGDLVWRRPEAAATGEIVANLVRALGLPLHRRLAEALWVALYTDTGGFRYAGTSAAVLRLGAELIEAGVEPWDMARRLYEENPPERLALLGTVLRSLTRSPSGRLACLIVSAEDLQQAGGDPALLDGFVNLARGISGVEVAAQIVERGDECRISLRSKGRVDVGRLAELLGGGGHRNAAGCRLPGAPEAVRTRLLAILESALLALAAEVE